MSLLRCVALCTVLTIGTVQSGCIPTQECELHQWVPWDCKDCCKQNASPNSARQLRVICCPTKIHTLTECLHHCNRTVDQVERYGLCKDHCTCPKGSQFATTTTSTQQITVSATNRQTTSTSNNIRTRIRTSNYPNTSKHAESTLSSSSATTPFWTSSTEQQTFSTSNIVKHVQSTVYRNAATKTRLTQTAQYTMPQSSKPNTTKRVSPTQTSSPKPAPSTVVLQSKMTSPNIKQKPTSQNSYTNKPVSPSINLVQMLNNSPIRSNQSSLIQIFPTLELDNSTTSSRLSNPTTSPQSSIARPISAMAAGNLSTLSGQSSPKTSVQPTINTTISTTTLDKTPKTVPGVHKMSTEPTDTIKNTPKLKETTIMMTGYPTTNTSSTKMHPFHPVVSGTHVTSNTDVSTRSTRVRQMSNNESLPRMHIHNNSDIGTAASDHGKCLKDATDLIGFGKLTGVPFIVTLFTCGIIIGALITTVIYHILQRKAQRVGVQQGEPPVRRGVRPGNKFVENLNF